MVYSIKARDLTIYHSSNPRYWDWYKDESAGAEVAKLKRVCWFDIRAHVPAHDLQKYTCYSTFLVFKLDPNSCELERATASVRFVEEMIAGTDDEGYSMFIDKSFDCNEPGRYPECREDGWMELNLGDFINNREVSSKLGIRIFSLTPKWKSGIIVRGIEIRAN